MRTGLLTFHYAHHYGAQLQAYALMKAVMRLGADCEIINYVRRDTVEGKRLFKKSLTMRSLLSNAHTLLHYGSLKRRYHRFESFVRDEMKLSRKFYGSYRELLEDSPAYDAYVCGSDQIWNPLIYKEKTFDPAFFADFAKSGKRIAYAPSFGISEIPAEQREVLKKYLAKFDSLSVRERQGEKIIREVSERESVTVLDPTLLLTGEEWSSIASEPLYQKPYLLCYFISDPSDYAGMVKEIACRYNLPIISLCGARRVVPQTVHAVLDAGPKEFLSLFRNASFVCTNSFHGTVFSINFRKDFVSFASSAEAGKTVNSRLYNILEKLDLTSRLYTKEMNMQALKNQLGARPGVINYQDVDRALQNERDLSLRYLEDALKGDIQ